MTANWLDALDEPPARYWKPEPGDRVVGRVAAVGEDVGKYDPYPTFTIDTDDGPVIVRAQHIGLRDRLEKLNPVVGEELAIKFHGEEESSNGKTYMRYTAVVHRTEDQPLGDVPTVDESPGKGSRDDDSGPEDQWAAATSEDEPGF